MEVLLAQLVVTMKKNNAPTKAKEGTKDHDHVGDLVVQQSKMNPCDLEKTFEGVAFCGKSRHEFVKSYEHLVGFWT